MGLVMAAVLVAAVVGGLGTATAIALGIVLAGLVGMVGVARRPREATAAEQIAAMMAPAPASPVSPTRATAVEAMAPLVIKDADPEAGVPRWRRPSLLEARRSDPTLQAPAYRLPMRFSDADAGTRDIRIVRYAVVPVLDRPDEILGLRVGDLETGDEVIVIGASGSFNEVRCPNGDRGWVHRTTLGQRTPVSLPGGGAPPVSQEADDALTALLSARGLI